MFAVCFFDCITVLICSMGARTKELLHQKKKKKITRVREEKENCVAFARRSCSACACLVVKKERIHHVRIGSNLADPATKPAAAMSGVPSNPNLFNSVILAEKAVKQVALMAP